MDMAKELRDQVETNLDVRLEMIGKLQCSAGWSGNEHSHSFWEILCVTKGTADISCDGGGIYHMTPGELFLLKPYEQHNFSCGNHIENELYII